jgi:hypothetical protein
MDKLTLMLVLATSGAFAAPPPAKTSPTAQTQQRYMATTPAPNTRATFYNSTGNKTGSAQTIGGTTTFRDPVGRTTGRAQQTSGGVIFTDSTSRTTSRATVTKSK